MLLVSILLFQLEELPSRFLMRQCWWTPLAFVSLGEPISPSFLKDSFTRQSILGFYVFCFCFCFFWPLKYIIPLSSDLKSFYWEIRWYLSGGCLIRESSYKTLFFFDFRQFCYNVSWRKMFCLKLWGDLLDSWTCTTTSSLPTYLLNKLSMFTAEPSGKYITLSDTICFPWS